MTMFGRYLFRQTGGALLLILGSLSGVVWIALALKQLKLVTNQGQDTWTLLKMTTLALPNLIAMIAPIALLIAAIHVLNRLNSDSELIVFNASGASPWRVATPLLAIALVIAGAVSVVNHYVMPWSSKLLRQYVIQVRTDLMAQILQPGRFTSPAPRLTIHIRERTSDGELRGLLMHDARQRKTTTSYLAERGRIIKRGDSAFLVMQEGHILTQDTTNAPPRIIKLDTYTFDLAEFHTPGAVTTVKPRELYFRELIEQPAKLAKNKRFKDYYKRLAGLFRAELHERFTNPLYPFAFVLFAIAFVGQAQSTRQNRAEATVAAFALAIALRLAGMGANNMVALHAHAVPLLYAIPLAGIAVGLFLIQRRSRPLQPSRVRIWLTSLADTLISKRLFVRRKQTEPEEDAPAIEARA